MREAKRVKLKSLLIWNTRIKVLKIDMEKFKALGCKRENFQMNKNFIMENRRKIKKI